MKKLIYVIVLTVIVVAAALFTYINHQTVRITYYGGLDTEIELALLLFITFVLGVLCAYFGSLISSLKLRRRLAQANKQLKILQNPVS